MKERFFMFELKEIRSKYDPTMPNCKRDYPHDITGMATVKGDDIEIWVDDEKQPHGIFEAKDSFFTSLIKKIHESTK